MEVHAQTWTGNQRMIGLAQRCRLRATGRSPHGAAVLVRGEPLEFIDSAISRQEWVTEMGWTGELPFATKGELLHRL